MKEIYKKKDLKNIETFKKDIRKFASYNNLIIQETDDSEQTNWVCQIRKDSKFTLGVAAKAITITINEFSDDTIKISVGEGKWISKIAGSAATMILSGPLFILAGATTLTGIFGQVSLMKQVYNLVEINFD